ncbi:hypothetical protein DY000_02032281 [Brassica cretica]|uniref:Uncharacterized protein n=1 Tax=Brassica cretica TaxID=69181 RepID=A0ABQ7DNC1_BRACR|nr:hypothetical protein DY000_02032281 [Brassica cretica]
MGSMKISSSGLGREKATVDEELHPRCKCHGVEYMLSTEAVRIAGDRCLNKVWLWLTNRRRSWRIKLRRSCGIGAQDKARDVTRFDAI